MNRIKFDWTLRLDTLFFFIALLISAGVFYEKTEATRRDVDKLMAADKENTAAHQEIVRTLSATAAIIDTHMKGK